MLCPVKICVALTVVASGLSGAQPQVSGALVAVRHWTLGDVTRVVIETTGEFEFTRDRVPDPDRLFFDLPGIKVKLQKRGMSTFPVKDPRLKQIRVAETLPGTARVVFDLEAGVTYTASMLTNPPRLIVELKPVTPFVATSAPPPEPVLTGPDASLPRSTLPVSPPAEVARVSPVAPPIVAPAPRMNPQGTRATSAAPLKTRSSSNASTALAQTTPPAVRAATPKPARLGSSQSMTRVLGLKIGRIVLDAGHGGHDSGTIGPGGLQEKDLVLDVSRRLGELIEKRLGAEVIYTRIDDTYVPLERRTEIANESKADLFLSIHANSSPASSSSGVETYYLNFTTSREAMAVAARENASSQKTVYELQDLVQKIALQDKVEESRQFASRVQQAVYTASLKSNSRTRNRGVRKAPFVVLIGAFMPSVLAELGFISNPRDEALFRKSDYRQRIAEGLYQGLSRYASTLSQFQVAQK
jgi:N-acetylmuramoyl-L-alanine amidase